MTGTLPAEVLFTLYHGDGRTPANCSMQTRGERGRYLADVRLVSAVRTALALERPLLVTGEPGTGKTALAWSVASELGLGEPLVYSTRSDGLSRDALYGFDHLLRLYHAQTQRAETEDAKRYVTLRALGQAIASATRRVIIIDEIDKAPRDFPNDLLDEIDRMEFSIPETGQHFTAAYRPVVILTSNSERQLPDPFLRRCVFHDLSFPGATRLSAILHERIDVAKLHTELTEVAVRRFLELREHKGFDKLPATGELVMWVKMLILAGVSASTLANTSLGELPHLGAIIKTRKDLQRLIPSAR